ncbi:FliM/FliN family flagellar motor switch protein [Granulicella sibirica]|uniref:Flagellar motor switch protein FliM n=1 Tax=Granulicella sibirica TaxID=2479048 RepID=A0A4Q0T5F2_9BACT|nr:FliM/FliN family flagellar motor switch protein [Granulicella sibirica]RXH57259.1 Flagellar motor switch protein FliM [Granulicella sibirica]
MKTVDSKIIGRSSAAAATILPCNFRSAGRLSNESARTLTTLHEVLARNLMNSLDVYLGTGLEVRLVTLEQLAMDDFKAKCQTAGYVLPCAARPSSNTVLLEMDNELMFTMVDLLLGGSGAKLEASRELTEMDEEIMEGAGLLIAQQIERVWQPIGATLTPGKCIKPNLAHRVFPPTEKVLRIQFAVTVAGMTGSLHLAFQASLASHLVRNVRTDPANGKSGMGNLPLPSLQKRLLDCKFAIAGDIPELHVSVKDLARIEVGSVLTLSAPVSAPGKLMLEGRTYFEASPVRQGNNKAMQLLSPVQSDYDENEINEDERNASS